MPMIPLTQGKTALVSKKDFVELSKYKWYANQRDGRFYAVRRPWDKKTKTYRTIYMHRQIMGESLLIYDHKNGDTLDNRRCNLRVASSRQNSANTCIKVTNKSGFKGVYYNKKEKRFVAQITHNYKTITLGSFNSALEAAKVYDSMSLKLNGKFARTNKMMGRY